MDFVAENVHCDHLKTSGSADVLSPLPLDLLLHLFSFLDPLDIIALRKTCKTLHEATLQRQVWLNTLRRVCVANSVFAPSLPFMEMTLLELEHAAVIPSLWRSISSANKPLPEGDDQPYRTKRILRGPTSHGDDGITTWGDTLDDLLLVPGGRYLILFVHGLMSVYDLGYTPDTLLDCNTRLLASVEIRLKWDPLVHPSPDGSALRIFVPSEVGRSTDFRWYKLQVYEIYPHHDHPQLELLSDWMPLGSSTQLYSVYLNRIVFLRGDILSVWDFVADTLATWRVVGASHKTIIANDSILLFGSTCISVWNIPALLPRDREHTTLPYVDVPIINPLFRIDYPECMPSLDDAIRTGSMIKGFGDWYTASAPWCYDIVLPSEAGFAISRYLVAFNKDMTGGTIKENACYEFMTTPDLDFFIEPYRVCDNQLVLSWTEGAWMECIIKTHTSTLSSQDTVTPRDDEPLILEEWKSNHFNMSLCPFSARLCFFSYDQVHVYDFRSPLCSNVQSE